MDLSFWHLGLTRRRQMRSNDSCREAAGSLPREQETVLDFCTRCGGIIQSHDGAGSLLGAEAPPMEGGAQKGRQGFKQQLQGGSTRRPPLQPQMHPRRTRHNPWKQQPMAIKCPDLGSLISSELGDSAGLALPVPRWEATLNASCPGNPTRSGHKTAGSRWHFLPPQQATIAY